MTKCGTLNAEPLHGPDRSCYASGAAPGERECGIPVVAFCGATGWNTGVSARVSKGGMI